ncbi:hypothetical protein B0H14DRAFT_2858413 [Mycena olivaceomarginata]|nr:hypothetical protein B0H14DRAFT_2858413 [Mycena olivaceomarginata]
MEFARLLKLCVAVSFAISRRTNPPRLCPSGRVPDTRRSSCPSQQMEPRAAPLCCSCRDVDYRRVVVPKNLSRARSKATWLRRLKLEEHNCKTVEGAVTHESLK